jgi:hypothetical protein
MSLLTDVADAVVTVLNAADLSQEFTAVRLWNTRRPLTDLSALRIDVVPSQPSVRSEPIARDTFQNDVSLDIAIRKKADIANVAELDTLANLVEEIADLFQQNTLTALPDASLQSTEHIAIADAEYQHTKHVFCSVLTLTFRGHTDN